MERNEISSIKIGPLPGDDPGVVIRRGDEARDHQLPHAEAGDRRSVCASASLASRTAPACAANIRIPTAKEIIMREVRRGCDHQEGARERMGHIELASPVSHIRYFKAIPPGWHWC